MASGSDLSSTKRRRARDERGRPEAHEGGCPFYDAAETARYSSATQRTGIQRELTVRALHLLHSIAGWTEPNAPPRLLLDIGCGAGASTSVARCCGHRVLGLDLSMDMLVANEPRSMLVCSDMAHGLPIRAGALLDGALSISALQWLCSSEREGELRAFLAQLHASLRPGASCVAQFYPREPAETARALRCAAASGFGGDAHDGGGASVVLWDLPHAKGAARLFLCLERASCARGSALSPGAAPGAAAAAATAAVAAANAAAAAASAAVSVAASAPLPSARELEQPRLRSAGLAHCPCAWPHGAACSLQLHRAALSPSGSGSGAFCAAVSSGLGEAAGAREAWEARLARAHEQLAKRLQHALQQLWAEAGLTAAEVEGARARLQLTGGGDGGAASVAAAPASASASAAPAPPGAAEAEPDPELLLRARSRLEAWLAGPQKASARSMEGAWRDAVQAGARGVAADAEAVVARMRELACFRSADLYLCRSKKRRRTAAGQAGTVVDADDASEAM